MQQLQQKYSIFILLLIWGVGTFYRFYLWDHFYGWEESDYGNLAMVYGVWDSGFTHFDMNHMPGYYAISALFLFIVDDVVVAAKLASSIGGSVAFLLSMWLLFRYGGFWPSLIGGIAMLIQPEFSLYASSSLREPVYACFLLCFLYCFTSTRYKTCGLFALLAFSVRFESPIAFAPLLLFLLFRKQFVPFLSIVLPLIIGMVLWSVYCHYMFDTYQFWAHATQSNVDTGLGAEAESRGQWFFRGAGVSLSLFSHLLPWRIGWLIWLGLFIFPFVVQRKSKWLPMSILAYSLIGVWLAIAFVAQHDPIHNLYWKWLCPFVPVVVPVGVMGVWLAMNHLSASVSTKVIVWGAGIGQLLFSHTQESQRQIQRAEELYAPQLFLAKHLEAQAPADKLLLIDNIPACWIRRQPSDLQMISWFDVPVGPNNPEQFSTWLRENNVWAVMWFKEDWTQAPEIAPFLSDGGQWEYNDVRLEEQQREDQYGWIYFQVKQ